MMIRISGTPGKAYILAKGLITKANQTLEAEDSDSVYASIFNRFDARRRRP